MKRTTLRVAGLVLLLTFNGIIALGEWSPDFLKSKNDSNPSIHRNSPQSESKLKET